jgi:Ca2+-binding EF-hand superfamily protein
MRVGTCLAATVLQAFKQLDKDGSGTISMDELTEACR